MNRLAVIVLIMMATVLFHSSTSQAQQDNFQWSKPIDITQPSNPDWHLLGVLLCDQYQNVHLFWANNSTHGAGAAIYYRNDVNGDWSTPTDVLAVSYPSIGGLGAVIADRSDTVHLFWKDQWIGGNLFHSQAPLAYANNPRAWSPPAIVPYAVGGGGFQIDASGIIHLVYGVSEGNGALNSLYYIRSKDSGITWSDPVLVVSLPSPLPTDIGGLVAIDDAGRIHVGVTLRSQEYGRYSEVGYVRSLDGGQSWSQYKQIADKGTTFQGVAGMAPYAFGRDEVHLTWHDPRRMHQWSFDGGATWSNPVEIMPLGAAFGGENQLVKDSAGTLYVVTAEGGGVYSARWDGTRWEPPERIDDRFIDPHGQNMVVCQGNRLHVVYYDRTGENRVWYASRQVDAPHIERRPLARPTPQPTVTATPDVLHFTNPTVTPDMSTVTPDISLLSTATGMPSSPWFSVLMATAPAAILVIGVVVVWLKRFRS